MNALLSACQLIPLFSLLVLLFPISAIGQTTRLQVLGSGLVNNVAVSNPVEFWDIEHRRSENDFSVVIGRFKDPFDGFSGLQWVIAEFQYGSLRLDPNLFRTYDMTLFGAPPNQINLLFIKDVTPFYCTLDDLMPHYISGSGQCARGSTAFASLNAIQNGTTTLTFYRDNGDVAVSWAFDIANSNLLNVCSHEFAVDPIGYNKSGWVNHSYVIPAWGDNGAPASPVEPSRKAILIGSSDAIINQLAPIPPTVKSYAVSDITQTLYPTRFFDACIDERDSPGLSSDDQNKLLTPNEWDLYVVGDKKIVHTDYPLAARFNNLFVNQMTKVYFLSMSDRTSPHLHFEQIVECHNSTGHKVGHYAVGLDVMYEVAEGSPNKSNLLVVKLNGRDLDLDANWHFVYRTMTPDIHWEHIEDLHEMEDRSVVVLIQNRHHPILYGQAATPHSPWTILHLNSDGTVRNAWACRVRTDIEPLHELLVGTEIIEGAPFMIAVGAYVYPRLGVSSSVGQCLFQEIIVESVVHDISEETRLMAEFPEPIIEVEVQRRVVAPIETVLCSDNDPCTTESGTVQLWGSHYDRGNDIAYFEEGLVSTGLCAGPYYRSLEHGVSCYDDCSDVSAQNTSILSSRGMDCHIIYTDNDFKFSDAQKHGWYRLLIDPVDVTIQCYPEEYIAKGNASFDVGYEISSDNDAVRVSGVLINRTNENGISCWGSDLCKVTESDLGGAGDLSASHYEVYNLGLGAPTGKALLFGKTHTNVARAATKFSLIENFYNLHDIDEKDPSDNTAARPQAISAEVFYAHAVSGTSGTSLESDVITLCVGLTTTISYDLDVISGLPNPDPSFNGISVKRGLLTGFTPIYDATDCSGIERVWASTISSTLPSDRGIGFADVGLLKYSNDLHHAVAVGYAQGAVGSFEPEFSIWDDIPTGGTGVLVKYDYDGTVLKCARIGLSPLTCSSNNSQFDGFVRLNAIDCFPQSLNTGDQANFIVVGSCNAIEESANNAENNEQIFIACYSKDLDLLWYRIVRPIAISNGELYMARARSVKIRDDGVIAVAGDMTRHVAVRTDNIDMFVLELDARGTILRGANLLKAGDCDKAEKDNHHAESIIHNGQDYALIGSTCNFLQPPIRGGSTPEWCGIGCFQQKGDIIGLTWLCTPAIHSGQAVEFGYYGTDGIEHPGDMDWKRAMAIRSFSSSIPAEVDLSVTSIASPCSYVRIKSLEIVKNNVLDEHDTNPCPDRGAPESNYSGGTYHGTSEIPDDCWP